MILETSDQRRNREEYLHQQEASNAAARREAAESERRFREANERNAKLAELARHVEESKQAEQRLVSEASGPATRLSVTRSLISDLYRRAALQDSQRALDLCPVCRGKCDDQQTLAHVPDLLKACDCETKQLARLQRDLEKAGEATAAALKKYQDFEAGR